MFCAVLAVVLVQGFIQLTIKVIQITVRGTYLLRTITSVIDVAAKLQTTPPYPHQLPAAYSTSEYCPASVHPQ